MSRFLYELIGLSAGVMFILALKGLSHPRTARRGNLLGAAGATIATITVFFYEIYLPLPNSPLVAWISFFLRRKQRRPYRSCGHL